MDSPHYLIKFILILSLAKLINTQRERVVQQECKQITNLFKLKDLHYPWWDASQQQQNQNLEDFNCPAISQQQQRSHANSNCCSTKITPQLETNIKQNLMQKYIKPKLNLIFKEKMQEFNDKFNKMLKQSHESFHTMFERTYGMLYIQHAHVFHSLFNIFAKYFNNPGTGGPQINLELKLQEFFNILNKKMFEVLNAQYEFNESYLNCATIVINEKQGFEIYKSIITSIKRSFIASRVLSLSLKVGGDVLELVEKIHLNKTTCLQPLAKLLLCPICTESRIYKPCPEQCINILSNCLQPNQISKNWQEYINNLINIIDRLLGPYNIEAVVEPIHIKISEIIMSFQENGLDLSNFVFGKCGKPVLRSASQTRNKRSDHHRSKQPQPQQPRQSKNNENSSDNKNIEKLIRDIKTKIKKNYKSLFDNLPKQSCNLISKDFSSNLCYNGTQYIKIDKNEVAEPTATKIIENKDLIIIKINKLLQNTNEKLIKSFNGLDVEFGGGGEIDSDDEDLISSGDGGSGSGMGPGTDDEDLFGVDDQNPDGFITKPEIHLNSTINFDNLPNFNKNNKPDDDDDEGNLQINSNEKNIFQHEITTTENIPLFETTTKPNKRILVTMTTTRKITTPKINKITTTQEPPPKVIIIEQNQTQKALAIIKLFTPIFAKVLSKIITF